MNLTFFAIIPKNLESFFFGVVTRIKLPIPIANLLNRWFASYFRLQMSEAEKPLEAYRTLEDLFTRRLKPGLRPLEGPFISPCDAMFRSSEPLLDGSALQAKGIRYSVKTLLYGTEAPPQTNFHPSWACSLYLAPHNYHRVHAPFTGQILSVQYIPGKLWPVNDTFTGKIPNLFCENERVVFSLQHEGGGLAYLVMVGAFHVGRIQIAHAPNFASNLLRSHCYQKGYPRYLDLPKRNIQVGDEIGTFLLGSSVILVLDRMIQERFSLKKIERPTPVKMGQNLGIIPQVV
ncbi:MAG: phosphatidylserine decarboxylase [Oligoflexales bacterium]|nr:phosphatidylserine decarboxylase [Oligoflexales bacterium]